MGGGDHQSHARGRHGLEPQAQVVDRVARYLRAGDVLPRRGVAVLQDEILQRRRQPVAGDKPADDPRGADRLGFGELYLDRVRGLAAAEPAPGGGGQVHLAVIDVPHRVLGRGRVARDDNLGADREVRPGRAQPGGRLGGRDRPNALGLPAAAPSFRNVPASGRLAQHAVQPLPRVATLRRVAVGPAVVVVAERSGNAGEVALDAGRGDIPGRLFGRALVDDQLRAPLEALEPIQGRRAVAGGVAPLVHAVVMAVGYERPPQRGDLVVVQPDVVARDGPARKAHQHHLLRVAPVVLAHHRHRTLAVGHRRVHVTPPLGLVSLFPGVDVRQAQPDEALACRQPVAEVAAFDRAVGHVAVPVAIRPIARVLDYDGVYAPGLPVGRQV